MSAKPEELDSSRAAPTLDATRKAADVVSKTEEVLAEAENSWQVKIPTIKLKNPGQIKLPMKILSKIMNKKPKKHSTELIIRQINLKHCKLATEIRSFLFKNRISSAENHNSIYQIATYSSREMCVIVA